MRSRKPYRATPISEGKRYRRTRTVQRRQSNMLFFTVAALFGVGIGTAGIALGHGGANAIIAKVKPIAVSAGLMRARAPRDGDYWRRCDAARAAGTAPIYRGEPGYRKGLDGDDDGIACEPYPGM